MNVTVQVRSNVAADLRRTQTQSRASHELKQTLAQLGLDLQPLHPGASDATLASFFIVSAPDHADIDRLLARLRACEAVESAYVKPPDELP